MFNKNWEFLNIKNLAKPVYMEIVDNELYITGDHNIYKTDKNVNLIKTFTNTGAGYRGIYYNKTNNIFYIAAEFLFKIDIFDRNLTLLFSISTGALNPYSMHVYNDQLIIGSTNGIVFFVQNDAILKNFSTLCAQHNMVFADQFGYFAIACFQTSIAYIYHVNGTYMNIMMSTALQPTHMRFDMKGQFIVDTVNEIEIYN